MSNNSKNHSLTQLALNLSSNPSAELENFVEPDGGQTVTTIRNFLSSPDETILFIAGESSTGKSHLLLASSQLYDSGEAFYLPFGELLAMDPAVLEGLEYCQLLCLDDIDKVAGHSEWEEALFHLFNRCQQQKCQWIACALQTPANLPWQLPDLKSRLGWGVTIRLPALDEQLRLQVLEQQAQHFGFFLSDEVKQFIIRRAPRDLGSLTTLLKQIDRASLEEKRAITVPFVKSITGW
ncbi:DnaA regulatory inactivator Hda [Hahella sp. CCB-MM4]|uniref:DnaA regulatory inactivator Hda n=1 Tax=Hahella sp. (strain CCB-MM4) TaxID=1926491 RepID=UPI000B9B07C9|nr:DnaA regulatory inactivator Hda [Hahella sp. CCB-MM4]OZG72491.1 DnaA regulatory inactivator Hda [Hahella sp. CCB-MM4]